jgi:photosystem II stability/assembly factor-like uncharacterized protein
MNFRITSALLLCALAGCDSTTVDRSEVAAEARPVTASAPMPTAAERRADEAPLDDAVHVAHHEPADPHSIDMGPPPFEYVKILGGAVPNWRPEDMTQGRLGPRSPLNWELLGPKPITSEYWSGNDDASGRVVDIAPHPVNPDTCYIASASGGIWKTIDGGNNWTPLTDELSNLNHGAIAIDPSNPETVYIGTGEYTTGSRGDGVFKSTDGGQTWVRLADADTMGLQFSGLAVDPTNPSIVHATTRDGYLRSDDAGATWVLRRAGRASALSLDMQNPSRVFIGVHDSGIYRSTDGGDSFVKLTSGLPNSSDVDRALVAVAASNPSVVYASFSIGSNVEGTYKSTNGGDTWSLLNATPNFASPQAWYDMYIAVDPTNENRVFAGGVSPIYANAGIIRSTNGGSSWQEISAGPSGGQTHPDHHVMAFGPTGIIWEGNDGGVWKSNNGGNSWINCNETLTVTQNYAVAQSPINGARVIGGTQDNGSIERQNDTLLWPQIAAGDGGFTAYDFTNANIKYTTYVYLTVQRHIGGNVTDISGNWGSDPKNFIAPLVMDPNDADTLYGGTNRVWRTTNASGGANWSAISTSSVGGGGRLNAIAVAPSDSNTIYTGSTTGAVYVTTDAATWSNRSAGLPSSEISDVVIDPDNPSVAYASFHRRSGGRIYRTNNLGNSWIDVTGNLPDGVEATALAVDWKFDTPGLYIGTGAGVWSSADGGATWIKDENDLPNVNVGDLQIDIARDQIIAGTYGRGTWRAQLPDLQVPLRIDLPNGAPDLLEPGVATTFDVEITPDLEQIVPGSEMLFYQYDGGGFVSVPLDPQGGNLYLATLPPAACDDTPEFFLSAQGDGGSLITEPADAPLDVYTAAVGVLEILAADDMEADSGWTVGAGDDDATTGVWNRMDPQPTDAQPGDDHTPAPGTICWVTDGNAGSGIGDFDIDGGKTTLFSPVYDLADGADPVIGYWRWYSNTEGASPNADIFVVDISNDGGGTWTNVETVGPTGPGTSGGWIYHEFHVTDVITPLTSQMQLRFVASDEGDGSIVEAAIDDLEITDFTCDETPCEGDLNGDGFRDLSDLGIVLASFQVDDGGDINGDGITDLQDLGILLAFYEVPCP